VADQPSRTYGRNASQIPSGLFGVLTVLTTGLVVAFLYFARDVIVPIALAVLLSFLLAPAVRWLRRLQMGRVAAVTLTVLIAFLAMLGFAAVVVQELSSLAQQLPEYRSNIEAKIRSLPGAVPGGGVLRRATSMVQELGRELKQSETKISKSADDRWSSIKSMRSTLQRSPLLPRECSSMLLTMPSARRPCSAILSRLPVSIPIVSSISVRLSWLSAAIAGAAVSFNSSSNSTERSAKLLTKLSGFLISWAMPAVNWPNEAIFSAWIRLGSLRKLMDITRLSQRSVRLPAAKDGRPYGRILCPPRRRPHFHYV
jgi:hypothetical protein